MSNIIFQYPCREGTSGLELEAVRHNYTRVTPFYGTSLVNSVLQALEDASLCASVELHAAVKIQATFRMHQQATIFREVRRKACTIQRMFRGYSTRKHLENERATAQKLAYLKTVFDVFATRIQACYRGYASRKMRSNYYAQQAYIHTVTARAAAVLEDAHRARVEQDKLRTAESQRVQALSYARRTAQMHHTISTCSIPSVYQRPPVSSERLVDALRSTHGIDGVKAAGGRHTGSGDEAGKEKGDRVLEDYELEQVAVFTAGDKLEEDIRQNSRAARHHRGNAVAPSSTARAATRKGTPPTSAAAPTPTSQMPCLPTLDAGKQCQKTSMRTSSARDGGECESAHTPAMPCEDAAATKAAASSSTRNAAPNASSLHPKFGVKQHDCVSHRLSYQAGVTQNSAAALERSVDQKIIRSVHGNAVFKVPAVHGRRTR
ncbi:IQ calmodulin-binding motif containing protein [Lotmaria passim]